MEKIASAGMSFRRSTFGIKSFRLHGNFNLQLEVNFRQVQSTNGQILASCSNDVHSKGKGILFVTPKNAY